MSLPLLPLIIVSFQSLLMSRYQEPSSPLGLTTSCLHIQEVTGAGLLQPSGYSSHSWSRHACLSLLLSLRAWNDCDEL